MGYFLYQNCSIVIYEYNLRKKRKCDVKNTSVDRDVTNVEVIQSVTYSSNNKGDVTNESDQDDKQ